MKKRRLILNLTQSLNEVFNAQVMLEYHNQLIYSQVASYFEDLQLKKIAEYFRKQSSDEKNHAEKFIAHINDRTGGKAVLSEVPNVSPDISSVFSVADFYVQTEEATTESIESIYELAIEEKSYIDLPFILEMLNEQVEEEDSAQEFALKIKNVKDLVLFDAMFS
jgi:ferritin